MLQIYLAIDYGSEGWQLNPYDLPDEALQAVKDGNTYGNKWKILKELDITVIEETD